MLSFKKMIKGSGVFKMLVEEGISGGINDEGSFFLEPGGAFVLSIGRRRTPVVIDPGEIITTPLYHVMKRHQQGTLVRWYN